MINFKKAAGGSVFGALALMALVSGSPASAQSAYTYGPDGTRYQYVDRRHGYRPLTVNPHRDPRLAENVPPPAYNPYYGPKAIVTAPVSFASRVVAAPFEALGSIFPAHGDPARNPLVLVGAPIHFAGALAQIPFNIIQAPFGGPPLYTY